MTSDLEYSVVSDFATIDPVAWRSLEAAHFPFMDYDFHAAMADCCGERTGWFPRYLLARRHEGVVGILPFYTKTNSYGEYIFDWDWAHAYHQHGLEYYPKWVVATPFTPATGPKCLADTKATAAGLVRELMRHYLSSGTNSFHALFLTPDEEKYWRDAGAMTRHSVQYHWQNRGYDSFDDFLSALKGKRRRQITRERSQLDPGVVITCLHGHMWHEKLASRFYRFYSDTIERKRAIPYLTESFFEQIFRTMRDRIVLLIATVAGEAVGASLSFLKGDTMYGRYWGCLDEYRNLHFEMCFYRTIEFAIARGLRKLEAGAQGAHKIQRGFDATTIYSAHILKDPRFDAAIRRYIAREKEDVAAVIADALSHSAYRPN